MAVGYTIVAFDTGVGSQTLNYELGQLNLGNADWMKATVKLTKADTDAGDTCDIYLQDRGPAGIWNDRIHFTQLLGTLSPTSNAPEVLEATLQQAGTLSDDEEESEPSGSAGASRLTAGTVRNGPFPGQYYANGVRGASWRVQVVVVDADNDADFEGSVFVEWNEA